MVSEPSDMVSEPNEKDYFTFAIYSVLSFVVCLAATFIGLTLTKA